MPEIIYGLPPGAPANAAPGWYYRDPTNPAHWIGAFASRAAAQTASTVPSTNGTGTGGSGGGTGGQQQQQQQTDPQVTALQTQLNDLAKAVNEKAIQDAAEQKRQWELQYALSQNADDRAYAQLQINQATAKLAQLQFAESQRQFNASTGLSLLNTAAQLQRPEDWFKYQQYTQGGRNLAAQLTGAPNADFQAPVGTTRAASIQQILNEMGLGDLGASTGGGAMPDLPTIGSGGSQQSTGGGSGSAQETASHLGLSNGTPQQQAEAAAAVARRDQGLAHPGITQIMDQGGAASANPMLDAAVAAILAGRSLTPEQSKALMAKPGGDISGAPGIDSSTSQADRKTLQTAYQSAIDQQNGKSESPGEWVNRTQLPNRLSSSPLQGGYIMNPQTGQYVEANNMYAPDLPGSTESWFGKSLAEQYAAMQQKWASGDFKHMGLQRTFWQSHGATIGADGSIHWDPSMEGGQGSNAAAAGMTTNAAGQRDSRSPQDVNNATRFPGWSTTPTPSEVVPGYTVPAKQQSQGKDPAAWTFQPNANQAYKGRFTRNDDGIEKKLHLWDYIAKFGALPAGFDASQLDPMAWWTIENRDAARGPGGTWKMKNLAAMPTGYAPSQALMDSVMSRAGTPPVANGTPVQGTNTGGIPLPAGNASGLASIPYAHQLNPAVFDKLGATGQALLQGAAQAAGWDWTDYQNQLNAARPKGTAARQTYTQRSADNLAMY